MVGQIAQPEATHRGLGLATLGKHPLCPPCTVGVPGMCSTPTALPPSPSRTAKHAVRYPVPDPTSSARPPAAPGQGHHRRGNGRVIELSAVGS